MLKSVRKGKYKGKEYIFTHKDPKANMVYSPDIKSFVDNMFGMWVNSEAVTWIDEERK